MMLFNWLTKSLSIARKQYRENGTLRGLSSEGWTLCTALAYRHRYPDTFRKMLKAPNPFRRWEELAPKQCDSHSQKQDLLNDLKEELKQDKGPLFDLGARRGKTIHFSNEEYNRWVSAYRAIRVCEVAGMPPAAAHMSVGSELLKQATVILAPYNYALAARTALRVANSEDDPVINRVWSRARIAKMSDDEVASLLDLLTRAIDYVVHQTKCATGGFTFWATRLRVLLEALSRLVMRLSPAKAEEVFRRALGYCNIVPLATHPWLNTATDNLLSRSWEALPPQKRSELVFDVLSAPIAGLDGLDGCDQRCPEPGDLLLDGVMIQAPERNQTTKEHWITIIQLVLRGLNSTGEPRKRAVRRLISLSLWNRLSGPESKQIAKALWNIDMTNEDAIPTDALEQDWILLLLPEPKPGISEERFRKKWFGTPSLPGNVSYGKYFYKVAHGLQGLKNNGKELILNTEELSNLCTIVESWADDPVIPDDDPMNLFRRPFGHNAEIEGLRHLLLRINLTSDVAEKVYAKAMKLNETGTPAFKLYAGLAKLCPQRINEIAESTKVHLVFGEYKRSPNGSHWP
jgi:hypothetical protein